MAINKARSGPFMKAVIVILAVVFALSMGLPFLRSITKAPEGQSTSTSGSSQLDTVAARYKSRVAANERRLQTTPKDFATLVDQGNAYFDWANESSRLVQNDAAALSSVTPLWIAAADYYQRALAVKYDANVATDRAVSLFYSGKATEAIALAESVVKKDKKFATAWYDLGIFYETSGNKTAAVKAFSTYLALKPTNAQQNVQTAQQKLKELSQSPSRPTTP